MVPFFFLSNLSSWTEGGKHLGRVAWQEFELIIRIFVVNLKSHHNRQKISYLLPKLITIFLGTPYMPLREKNMQVQIFRFFS